MAVHGRAVGRESRNGMLSVRLGADERKIVGEVAERRGETISQFARDALLEKAGIMASSVRTYSDTKTMVGGISLEANDEGRLMPRPESGKAYVRIGS